MVDDCTHEPKIRKWEGKKVCPECHLKALNAALPKVVEQLKKEFAGTGVNIFIDGIDVDSFK